MQAFWVSSMHYVTILRHSAQYDTEASSESKSTAKVNGAEGYAHHSNTAEWIIKTTAVLNSVLCVQCMTKPTVQLQEATEMTYSDQSFQLCIEQLQPKLLQGFPVTVVDSLGVQGTKWPPGWTTVFPLCISILDKLATCRTVIRDSWCQTTATLVYPKTHACMHRANTPSSTYCVNPD